LAEVALQTVIDTSETIDRLVFDSIRHPDEILALRKQSRNCFVVSVASTLQDRWRRLEKEYEKKGLSVKDFMNDDATDAYEDMPYGQKVQLCVDNADIAIRNDVHYGPDYQQMEELGRRFGPFLRVATAEDTRTPSFDESMMALAYTKALSSSCYKRQVGAVICDEDGTVLGVGCNDNPYPLAPCFEQWGECLRDRYKSQLFDDLEHTRCPDCGEELGGKISPEYRCEACGFNLDAYYVRDKALGRCSALHAEEAAIISVGGRNLRGCTIFTTTFPCLLCAKKIIGSGIARVVYCEPYPDPDGSELFAEANKVYQEKDSTLIRVNNFEGIKARAYFKLFGSWRRVKEAEINEKRRK